MIIGRGLLASALKEIDREQVVFYANGISNSTIDSIATDNFEAKQVLEIAAQRKVETFIYFSTIQVNAEENYDRPYVIHKIKMEELVRRDSQHYLIIRTSNIIGKNPWNSHTLFNYLYNSLKEKKEINVIESASRNILDVEHFIKLLDHYLVHYKKGSATVNIVNSHSCQMHEILSAFENIFDSKFLKNNATIKIAKFEAPCLFSAKLIHECGIDLDNYLANVIKKYYPIFKKDQPV